MPKAIDLNRTFQETLYNIFKLFDVDSNEYLKQDQWIENIKGRLT